MNICTFCDNTINARKGRIFCGVCKKPFHSACVTQSTDELGNILKDTKGLLWRCESCVGNYIIINQNELVTIVEQKVQHALTTLTAAFDLLKTDIIKIVDDKITSCQPPKASVVQPKYSDILKNKTLPAIIIQPKNQTQPNSKTKSDIMHKVDPVKSDIQLSKVKHVRNGGILISCQNASENEKFKKLVQDNLPNSYEVKEVHGISPRVRIVGITENYEEEQLLNYIFKSNRSLIHGDSICKLIKFSCTKKNSKIFQAILQLDTTTYDRVITTGNLFVGYDSCRVFDAVSIYRCFNCNEFHHSSKHCNNTRTCPRCSQDHDIKECKSTILCCSNCLKLKNLNDDVNCDHAVWDINNCTAYIQACHKLRNDILAGQ